MLQLVGEVSGLHLLDLTCGNGDSGSRFARQGAIQEVARVLGPKGRFVASLSHPCFDKVNTSGWEIEHIYPNTTIWRKMSHYREIAVADLPWQQVSGQIVYCVIEAWKLDRRPDDQ